MSTTDRPTLFELLPAVYRVRDAEHGHALEAVLSAVQQEVDLLEADVERLYDNWFIETCDEWAVPYIGDLLGVSGLLPVEDASFSQRGLVANTIAYRRAKGTVAVLEQLARDVTGWPAKAVEFFQLLSATRSMNHERSNDATFFPVRDANRGELVATPFDASLHSADVRHIDNGRGRHNIAHVGIHLWRLPSYAVTRGTARRGPDAARWHIDPLGRDLHLFNTPSPERDLSQLAQEVHVPTPLRRRPLHDELEALRKADAEREAAAAQNLAAATGGGLELLDPDRWFDDSQPVVRVFARATGADELAEIPRDEIVICNLGGDPADGGWRRPATPRSYDVTVGGEEETVELRVTVAVDPVLGRLAFARPRDDHDGPERTFEEAEVSYAYGFPGDLGGGPYSRRESLEAPLDRRHRRMFQYGVTRDPEIVDDNVVKDLATALRRWNDYLDEFELDPDRPDERPFGVIAVMDSRTYGAEDDTLTVRVPNGCTLLIVAAGWPVFEADAEHERRRRPGFVSPEAVRPLVRGRLEVDPAAGDWPELEPGELVLNGLLLADGLTVLPGDLGGLDIAHCTLVPGSAALDIQARNADGERNSALRLVVERSICGRLAPPATVPSVRIAESIVDGGDGGVAVDAREVAVTVEASTLLGRTTARTLSASNSIFTGVVTVERRQTGCVRYSYVPPGSVVPRPFRCQPREAGIAPTFAGTRLERGNYAQLGRDCPAEIATGADDEAEMGAWRFLKQPQRLRNLTTRLDEYLRFGLEAGVFYIT
jgi:Phage tail protein (Tail_P2_I)